MDAWNLRSKPAYFGEFENEYPIPLPADGFNIEDKQMHTPGHTGGRNKTRRASSGNGSIVTAMMEIRDQIKVYHWQTKSFARHKATDDFVTTLDGLIDSFVEVYMGKYGRPKVSGSIKLHNFSESAAKSFVAKQTAFLSKVLPRKLKSTDTDLLNIRDEVLALVNKTNYLFTLN